MGPISIPTAGSTHIEELKKFVKEKQLDVGFAYDGDADRCIAVDDQGNEVNGDLIMYVCGNTMKEQGQLKKQYSGYNSYVQSGTL